MNDVDVRNEILKYKKINTRNNVIIMLQLAVLLFVVVMAVYIKYFG